MKRNMTRWVFWLGLSAIIGAAIIGSLAAYSLIHFSRAHHNQPARLGYSFSAHYARELGLDPLVTLTALLNEIPAKQVRLMSYWNEVETKPGSYDFSQLDQEVKLVGEHSASVSLAIGMRQPRYPECHLPDWAGSLSLADRQDALLAYLSQVIKHYRNNATITSWQLENEALNRAFGICPPPDRAFLNREYQLVKSLDGRPIIMSVSDEVGLPVGSPFGDEIGISLYRRYYENQWLHRYVTYPLPAWFYRLRASIIETFSGRPVVIHELQAEPWGPDLVQNLSLAEQDKTMNADRLVAIVDFAKSTGIKQMDLWGAEWWYWRKVKAGDPSVWEAARQIYR